MSHQALFRQMEARVEAERKSILDKARAEADRILENARKEADAMTRTHKELLESRIRLMHDVILNRAHLEADREILKARTVLLDRVFAEAVRHMRSLKGSPAYEAISRKLLAEALAGGEVEAITVAPEDDTLYRRLLGTEAIPVHVSPSISAGLVALLRNGDRIVNTFESRLDRCRLALLEKVEKILFPD